MTQPLPLAFVEQMSVRIRELRRALLANTVARAHYRHDPVRNAILIRQCDRRILEAHVELEQISAVLDSIEAAAQQATVDGARP